jgi:RNA-directed DNA polymerase
LLSTSYGFRPGRGAKDALRRVDHLLKAGQFWIVDADLKSYFDNIPQDQLLTAVAKHISDGALLDLLGKMLRQGVLETGKGWKPTDTGTPQGAVVSPLLANLYLNPLDHLMATLGKEMVRYADDFVVLCQTKEEAEEVLGILRQWVAEAGLTLHPTKTRIVDATQKGGFDFLGYHFERGYRWPRQKSVNKFRDKIREKTRKLDPRPLREIVEDVNRTLRGWFEYFRHSVKNVFIKQDTFVRQRLRTIERKRHKLQGRARGRDHQRWPKAYFADLGLISLALARDKASRSQR